MYIMFRLIALFMMLLSVQTAIAEEQPDATQAPTAPGESGVMPPVYPSWPERTVQKNIVPPPPPGPYMSTALTYAGTGFSCCPGSEKDKEQQVDSPSFNTMQWPERRRPPMPWVPESGEYTFAPDNAVTTPGPTQANPYGYQGGYPWQPMYPPPPRRYR